MLWLGLYFRDLPLEVYARGQQGAQPLLISEYRDGCERVCRCSAPATAAGIRPGMSLAAALALQANLTVRPRDPRREQQALEGLARWAYQFSSRIHLELRCLLLEVGASLRLFGGLQRLLARLERELPGLGFRAQLASAPTAAGAALLARARPGASAADLERLREQIAAIPLMQFTRARAARELVKGVGLDTLGDCLALPRPELARRIGPALGQALAKLLGQVPDPRPLWQPPAVFEERLELLGEITTASALVFPARRLMLSLSGFLRGHGGGTQTLLWRLEHRDAPDSRFSLGLLEPSRDPDHMLDLLRERSERLQLAAPVVAIGLQVTEWSPYAECSADLFGDGQVLEKGRLERLRNRLGEAAVQGLQSRPDHRPECAWRLCPPGQEDRGVAEGDADADHSAQHRYTRALRPLWLLKQPRPLRATAGCPSYGGPLQLIRPAERIEAGWWNDADVARDYYVALSPAGERLWIYRDRRADRWYLHGLLD